MLIAQKSPVQALDEQATRHGERIYLRQPLNRKLSDFSWIAVRKMTRLLAGSLSQLGFNTGDRIAILSKNCAEWFITDLALMSGGYISVPIYPTANADTIDYVLKHSGAKAMFVGKLDDWSVQEKGVPKDIMRLAMPYDTMPAQYHWQQLMEMAPPLKPHQPEADEAMSIIYTSGSTGHPKGAVVTYSSFGWASRGVAQALQAGDDDRVISYLPLAHITERVYIEGNSLYSGLEVYFSESIDTFIEDVQIASPTLFISIPRLWTLFQQSIIDKIGYRKLNLLLSLPLVRRLVAGKIRTSLGLQNARVFGCGSAPVAPTLLRWYERIGMQLSEAWGMTENSAYATLNYPFRTDKVGSVGCSGIDCEVMIGDNQELLFKSPGLFKEYYNDPVATAEAFTADGFFRTGDQAEIDVDHYVTIIGRVKDTFKTAKGKYVTPVPMERQLAQNHYIELVCIIGSGLPYPVALVQLSEGAARLPKELVAKSLQESCHSVNAQMESHSVLGGILIVQEPWTIKNEVLTPTLKIKRQVLDKRFADKVTEMRKEQVLWER